MTLDEKKRKLRIINMILICNWLLVRKGEIKSVKDLIEMRIDNIYWHVQYKMIQDQPLPNFPIGGMTYKTSRKLTPNEIVEAVINPGQLKLKNGKYLTVKLQKNDISKNGE